VNFKDHFSMGAALYRAYRPTYPPGLFEAVAGLTHDHDVALDCATGNGQAAVGLARVFERVIAIDASEEQIARAETDSRIEYRVAPAEATGVASGSVNLVTAAQALHWLDAERFFSEAKRVLVPGGAIAVWGYGDPILDTPVLDEMLHDFNRVKLEEYWHPERKLLLDGYRTIAFPFEEIAFPQQQLEMRWTLPELAGYLRTWSATAAYVAERGADPVEDFERAIAHDWGDPATARLVSWPLYIRAGKTREY
jgi:SAM-dependent methyltransferase